jgi:ABC-type branched-subunit amino acid transport system ATPase component
MTSLELRQLSVVRSRMRVVDRASISLERREIVVVIGPNGAGKSTLLQADIGAAPLAWGQVVSIGVSVANALLLVTFARDRREAGEAPATAAVTAASARLHPVLMTVWR